MQTSRLGGSSEMDDIAVAVMPIGLPPTQMVMTLTVEAMRRIARRKSVTSSRVSVIAVPLARRAGGYKPSAAGKARRHLRHPPRGDERGRIGHVERGIEFGEID